MELPDEYNPIDVLSPLDMIFYARLNRYQVTVSITGDGDGILYSLHQ